MAPSSQPRIGPRLRLAVSLGLALALAAGAAGPGSNGATAAAAGPAGAMGSATVDMERLGGADQYAVSVAISQRLFPHGAAPVVYIVSGTAYADGLAAAAAAARNGGAVLYTALAAVPDAVAAELVRLAPPRVEVIGGPAIIAPAVVDQLTALLPAAAIERVGGADPYATAAALSAQDFPTTADTVFVASGESFQDAVAAGPAAAQNGAPLLLTQAATLPAATAAELTRLHPQRVYVVGDITTVSAAVFTAIDYLVTTAVRVGGTDHWTTAMAAATQFRPGAATVLAASGLDYGAGLAAVPLAAARAAPIVYLQADDQLPAATRDYLVAARPTRLVLAGEVSLINQAELIGFSDGRLTPVSSPAYPSYDSGFHDPGEMLTLIKATEIAYPTLVHVFSIGKSFQGRDIWAAEISSDVSVEADKPGVLFDALHHADEHLSVEQALYMLNILTSQYSTDPYVRRLVNERAIFIIFAVNPDGWAYDLSGGVYHFWRKNRQLTGGYYGTDINRNYSYKFSCCGGSSHNPYDYNYRGTGPFSTPEARAVRDFVASRVINGVQQIKTHVTLHVNGELILYPDGWTQNRTPSDIPPDDLATFQTMGATMARMNGYTSKQSSYLYITDGDEIDWMYHTYRIFSYTFELYPTDQKTLKSDVYPHYDIVPAQTARNRGALLYIIAAAGCPWAAIGKAAVYCGAPPSLAPPSGAVLP